MLGHKVSAAMKASREGAYTPGMAFERPDEALNDILANRCVYVNGRLTHYEQTQDWPLWRLAAFVRQRLVRRADPNPASPFDPFPLDEMF
jgi:hypothetical protein